jgi:hypothetical protein
MNETDYEKLRRELREMEGKNISHYSVLLTAFIRTKVENARMIAILSAAGIALMALVLMTAGMHGGWKLLFTAGVLLAFLTSLWISIGVLENSAESLRLVFKEGAGRDLVLDGANGMAQKFFMIGCSCLIALGLLSVWSPKFKKACCPMKNAVMMKDRVGQDMGNVKGPEETKFSDQSEPDIGAINKESLKTTAVSASQGSTSGAVSQKATQKSGNAGVFPRGVSK